jgi:hypothetical protein
MGKRMSLGRIFSVVGFTAAVFTAGPSVMAQCAQWNPSGSVISLPANCKAGIGTTTPQRSLDIRDGDLIMTNVGVSHGMTDILPTNAFFTFKIDTNFSGGVSLVGATASSNGVPFNFQGVIGTPTPPPGLAAVWFHAYKKNGASWQALGPTDTAFRFRSSINDLMTIMGSGNVGLGTTTPAQKLDVVGNVNVTGDITAGGVIGALYEDVAEWVPVTEDLAAGTVVILNPLHDNQVMASKTAYDTTVAGVVSEQPGLILGVASKTKEMVATTGRVKVKVSAAAGPIKIGDLLVTSDKPGVAMKSTPVDVSGIKLHRPGTIIGKALQALPAGDGEILVLLSLQ